MGGEGGFGQGLGQLALGFSQEFATIKLREQVRQKQQEAAVNIRIAEDLASKGLFSTASKDLIKSIEKTAGKDALPALFQLDRSNQELAKFRQGAIDITEAPVREEIRRPPLFRPPPSSPNQELSVDAQGRPVVRAPGPLFTERPPTDIERFQRFRSQLGPTGVSLIGGNQLGALNLGELQAQTKLIVANKTQKSIVDKFVVDLALQGRQALPFIKVQDFDESQIPDGFFPVSVAGVVIPVQAKDKSFKFRPRFNEMAVAIGKTPAEVDEKDSREIIGKLKDQDLAIAEERGRAAAQIKEDAWRDRPIDLNFTDHGYFDKGSGNRLAGFENQQDVLTAQQDNKIVRLNTAERSDLLSLKNTADTWNAIAAQVKAVYGPGGIFENLGPDGRIGAAFEGGFARFFQTDTELVKAARALESNLSILGRSFGGQRGAETERDTDRMRKAVAKLTGIPDTKEVALETLEEMRNLIVKRMQTILQNPGFTNHGLTTFGAVTGGFGPGTTVNPAVVNIVNDAAEARAIVENMTVGGPPLPEAQMKVILDFVKTNPTTRDNIQNAVQNFLQQAQP